MSQKPDDPRPGLLVLASTYPRWTGDHEPGFVHALAQRLARHYRVTALVPRSPGAAPLECLDGVEVVRYAYAPRRLETLVNDGGIVTNLRRHPWKLVLVPGFVLAQMWWAWRLARRHRFDVIHAHWLIPQGLIAALLRKLDRAVPGFLVTSHGADLFALRGSLLNALKRFVLASAGATTVVSQAMREELERIGADVRHVEVRPMGVDLSGTFLPDPSVPRSAHQLLFVGRMVEKKGLGHLIGALPAILAAEPEVTLTVAGFGPEMEAMVKRVEALGLSGKVRFLGAVAQQKLPDLLRRATALVAPFVEAGSGDQEGLGLVMVEALGCGCPVVTTRISAVRDVFADGWPTYCADPGSSDSLAREVLRLLHDRQYAWSEASQMREGLRTRFDWLEVAAGYERALQRACASTAAASG